MAKNQPTPLDIIYCIPLEELHPHPLNPYGVRDDPAMQELVGSVKENGVLIPAIARPRKTNYEKSSPKCGGMVKKCRRFKKGIAKQTSGRTPG